MLLFARHVGRLHRLGRGQRLRLRRVMDSMHPEVTPAHHSSSHPMDKVTGHSQATCLHSRTMATRRNLMWYINQVP